MTPNSFIAKRFTPLFPKENSQKIWTYKTCYFWNTTLFVMDQTFDYTNGNIPKLWITFKKKVTPRGTIYNTINRMQHGGKINDKKKTGRPTSWTPARKTQLKLANDRKEVSQKRLGRKWCVSHITICRQLSKMNISC